MRCAHEGQARAILYRLYVHLGSFVQNSASSVKPLYILYKPQPKA